MSLNKKINVGVYGGTGFVGRELCRLLLNHRNVDKIFPTSRDEADFERENLSLLESGLKFYSPEYLEDNNVIDVVFFATPHGEAMEKARGFLDRGIKVIDLSPDFRFKDAKIYEGVYEREHTNKDLLKEAVYGITEFNRPLIEKARLVANPGCYVITAMLGLAPVLEKEIIDINNIPINAVNGTTGASSKPIRDIMHTSVFGNMMSYNMEGHRHSAELEDQIKEINNPENVLVNFNVAVGNFARGVHSVASPLIKPGKKSATRENILELYKKHYENEPFVRIVGFPKTSSGVSKEYDVYPQIRNIVGTNYCDIGVDIDRERGILKIISVADNLNKGSAGSAIQNMNVIFGFDETTGLKGYAA